MVEDPPTLIGVGRWWCDLWGYHYQVPVEDDVFLWMVFIILDDTEVGVNVMAQVRRLVDGVVGGGAVVVGDGKRSLSLFGAKAAVDAAPAIVVRRAPVFSVGQRRQIGAMLAAVLGVGLADYDVREVFGRVFLIAYVPLASGDPVLPFVLRDYGPGYQRAYMRLGRLFEDYGVWGLGWDYKLARRAADVLIDFVTGDADLCKDEQAYFCEHLLFAIAMPDEVMR